MTEAIFEIDFITLTENPQVNKHSYVYILTNYRNTVLYVGVTSDLGKRIRQHKNGSFKNAFTTRYKITKLVYYELFVCIDDAIAREKLLKAGSRQKKLDLINNRNPEWNDLMLKDKITSLRS